MICSSLDSCIHSYKTGESFETCKNERGKCVISCDRRSNVKCEENKMVYQYENEEQSKVIVLKMDGGIIKEDASVPSGTKKCDFLVYIYNSKTVILTELKGEDISTAFQQIDSSLKLFESFYKDAEHVYGRIIPSCSQPKLYVNPSFVKLNEKLKKYKGNLKVKSRFLSENSRDLAKAL